MRPVLICQFDADNPPRGFRAFLCGRGISHRIWRLDQELPPAADPRAWSGVCLMGGPMMVGDPLPWMQPVLALLRRCIDRGVPVIGHCLGGQMLAAALGAHVGPHPYPEVGWSLVRPVPGPAARHWLGALADTDAAIPVFQWHFQAFALPPGASRLLTHDHMPEQAFVLGPHLGLQPHLEVGAAAIARWYAQAPDMARRHGTGGVMGVEAALGLARAHLPSMRELALRLYARWWEGCRSAVGSG